MLLSIHVHFIVYRNCVDVNHDNFKVKKGEYTRGVPNVYSPYCDVNEYLS
ncbi:hypothetical protein JPSP43_17040 [Staphylococcus pseudintermedius]